MVAGFKTLMERVDALETAGQVSEWGSNLRQLTNIYNNIQLILNILHNFRICLARIKEKNSGD